MARGRLASATISAYQSGKVYSNSSGNEASITVNAAVLGTTNSIVSVGISTNDSLVTSSESTIQVACVPVCCISYISICDNASCPSYNGYYARPIGVTSAYVPNYVDCSGNVTCWIYRNNAHSCYNCAVCLYCICGGTCTLMCACCTAGISTTANFCYNPTNKSSYEDPELLLSSSTTSDGSKFPVISNTCNGCVYYFKDTVLTTPQSRSKHYINPTHAGACTPTGASTNKYIASATDYWSTEKTTLGIVGVNQFNHLCNLYSTYCYFNYTINAYPKIGYTWVNGSTVCDVSVCPDGACNSQIRACTPCTGCFNPGFEDVISQSDVSGCQNGLPCVECYTLYTSNSYKKSFINESGPAIAAGCNVFLFQSSCINHLVSCSSCEICCASAYHQLQFIAGSGSTLRCQIECAAPYSLNGCNSTTFKHSFYTAVPDGYNVISNGALIPYPVRWMTYNPITCCNYLMVHTGLCCNPNSCYGCCENGIYSICWPNLCSQTTRCYSTQTPDIYSCCYNALKRHRVTRDVSNGLTGCCVCGGTGQLICASKILMRVGNIPCDLLTCCAACFCPSPVFRTSKCEWKFSVYDNGYWVDYTSSDMTCWTRNTLSCFSYQPPYPNTPIYVSCDTCIKQLCDCFYSVISSDSYIDYQDTLNAYERTGLVVSDGDSIYVSNCSDKQLSVQVWGYEG